MKAKSPFTATFASIVWAPDRLDQLLAPIAAGPLLADAEVGGCERGKGQPFHGYYFRILRAQGPHAHGGAKDYVVDGRITGGFAVLAYPVEYGASGVMSFLVSRRGTVFQRALGSSPAETAEAIKTFDPDSAWKRVN